jgi:leucyl/phenylalanyl-tRNA--protein transferase
MGGLFAGESMFHHERDASKAALVGLVDLLDDGLERLVDTQWQTPHLASLGVSEIPRADYLALLPRLLEVPPPAWPGPGSERPDRPAM